MTIDIEALDADATHHFTPCGEGEMVWRDWGALSPCGDNVVVLCHGGAGAWTHWYRNIEALRRHYRVLVPDLPGLGESAELPSPYTVADAGRAVARGLELLLRARARIHLLTFSWGCSAGSSAARFLVDGAGPQVASLLMTGPAGLGPVSRGNMSPLLRRNAGMSAAEERELHRENLARLMVYRRERISELAVDLQVVNANRSRFFSPGFARETAVRDALEGSTMALAVIYGEHDAPVTPHFAERRAVLESVRPDVRFEVIPDVGHWVPYEWSGYNDYALAWLSEQVSDAASP
ncbi:MAG: alpha/beta fold hydrolase [Pseudomonadota bacterium]